MSQILLWSTKYLLADSTYKSDYPTIAIFNSMLLKEFFDENHYHFTHSFAFDPVLNDGLRKALEQMPAQVDKKKQILVYGRPGTERNAFNLVVAALKKWVMMQPDIEEWEILFGRGDAPFNSAWKRQRACLRWKAYN